MDHRGAGCGRGDRRRVAGRAAPAHIQDRACQPGCRGSAARRRGPLGTAPPGRPAAVPVGRVGSGTTGTPRRIGGVPGRRHTRGPCQGCRGSRRVTESVGLLVRALRTGAAGDGGVSAPGRRRTHGDHGASGQRTGPPGCRGSRNGGSGCRPGRTVDGGWRRRSACRTSCLRRCCCARTVALPASCRGRSTAPTKSRPRSTRRWERRGEVSAWGGRADPAGRAGLAKTAGRQRRLRARRVPSPSPR